MERGCQVESELKLMRLSASNEELYEVHRLIHDLNVQMVEIKNQLKSEHRKAPLEKQVGNQGIIRSVPSKNILYCSPPKCGTTNWQRGMQVLTDISHFLTRSERANYPVPKPENYDPIQLGC